MQTKSQLLPHGELTYVVGSVCGGKGWTATQLLGENAECTYYQDTLWAYLWLQSPIGEMSGLKILRDERRNRELKEWLNQGDILTLRVYTTNNTAKKYTKLKLMVLKGERAKSKMTVGVFNSHSQQVTESLEGKLTRIEEIRIMQ